MVYCLILLHYTYVPLSAGTGSLSVLSPDELVLHSAPQLAEPPTHPWPLTPAAVCVRVRRGFGCTGSMLHCSLALAGSDGTWLGWPYAVPSRTLPLLS